MDSNARNDAGANLEALWQIHSRHVFAYVIARIGHRQDAEDLTQQVFEQAVKSLNQLRNGEKSAGWIFRIAENKISDFLRRKKSNILPLTGKESIDKENQGAIFQHIPSETLWGMIAKLPPQFSQILALRYTDNLTCSKIADELGEPLGTITNRLHRAYQLLRNQIQHNTEN